MKQVPAETYASLSLVYSLPFKWRSLQVEVLDEQACSVQQ